jgi:4-hydroxy-3-polyprenylbenzoate decarboxylase
MSLKSRLIIGISGASGAIYGVRLLQALQDLPVETHLVMSKAAEMTLAYETEFGQGRPGAGRRLVPGRDVGKPSGSFQTLA